MLKTCVQTAQIIQTIQIIQQFQIRLINKYCLLADLWTLGLVKSRQDNNKRDRFGFVCHRRIIKLIFYYSRKRRLSFKYSALSILKIDEFILIKYSKYNTKLPINFPSRVDCWKMPQSCVIPGLLEQT